MSDVPTELTPEEAAQFDAQTEETQPVEPITEDAPAAPAATPEAAEPAPAAETNQESAPQESKTVPLATLIEEQKRRKAFDRENRELRERLARLEGRFEAGKPQEQAQQPTIETQPLEILQDVAEWKRQQVAREEAQTQFGQFTARVNQAEQEFMAKTPDFGDALKHLHAIRHAELQAVGIPAAEGEEYIRQEALAIASRALQEGINPAERFYALAQARGYQRAAQAAPAATPDAGSAALLKAAEKLEKVAKGQAASKSLSSAGGAGNTPLTVDSANTLSLKDLSNLSDDAWERM